MGADENFGGYARNDAITVSWSIFAEGVPRHDKCALLSSDPPAPQHLSFVKNLCAHNGDRNPDVNFMPGSCVEVVNNVLYNAQSQFTEVWESYGGTPVNIIGNYYRRGPDTPRLAFGIDRPLVGSKGPAKIYQIGQPCRRSWNNHRALGATGAGPGAPVCRLASKPMPARRAFDGRARRSRRVSPRRRGRASRRRSPHPHRRDQDDRTGSFRSLPVDRRTRTAIGTACPTHGKRRMVATRDEMTPGGTPTATGGPISRSSSIMRIVNAWQAVSRVDRESA